MCILFSPSIRACLLHYFLLLLQLLQHRFWLPLLACGFLKASSRTHTLACSRWFLFSFFAHSHSLSHTTHTRTVLPLSHTVSYNLFNYYWTAFYCLLGFLFIFVYAFRIFGFVFTRSHWWSLTSFCYSPVRSLSRCVKQRLCVWVSSSFSSFSLLIIWI